MEGWRRDMYADETGLPWVMPSPNMPTLDTAIVYPGTVLFEGHDALGGPRHDAAVRAGRRAVDRRRALRARHERARAARRALPAGGVRADVPEAREADVRRLPDPRDRRGTLFQPGADRRRADRDVPARRTRRSSRGGSRRTSTSTTSCRSTSSPARTRCGSRSKRTCRSTTIAASWRDDEAGVQAAARAVPAVLSRTC